MEGLAVFDQVVDAELLDRFPGAVRLQSRDRKPHAERPARLDRIAQDLHRCKIDLDNAGPIKSRRYLRYLTDFHRSLNADHEGERRLGEFVNAVNRHYPAAIPTQRGAL